MKYIREAWSNSRTYRVLLVLAIIYAALRLVIVAVLAAQTSVDLQRSYVAAAQHFQAREDLYIKGPLDEASVPSHYLYSPAFAFFFSPILLLPLQILLPLMLIFHVAAYVLLYVWWHRIFEQSGLFQVARQWAYLLPLYLVFSAFWDDATYLNTYLIVALFATFLIEAILFEKFGWAAFWLGAVILPIKPHWAFALALPLLLGRYRFFFKLLLGAILAYLIVSGITIMVGGIDYGIRQYQDYLGFLTRLTRDYPWRGPAAPFLGYNHSIMQIVLYSLGVSAVNMRLATIIKLILLIPLGWISLKFLRNPGKKAGNEVPETALALIFVFYLGAFIWLDMVWELSLGVIIFAYLLATSDQKYIRVLLWILFGPYALLDIWRLVSYLILRENVFYDTGYIITDPFVYVPWIMGILLVFYRMLLLKLKAFRLNYTAEHLPESF